MPAVEALESSSTGPFNPMEIKYGTIICFLKCRTNDQNRRCIKISRAEKSKGCSNNSFCYRMPADTQCNSIKALLPLCAAGEGTMGQRGVRAVQGMHCPCPGERAARATLPLQQQPATAPTEPTAGNTQKTECLQRIYPSMECHR